MACFAIFKDTVDIPFKNRTFLPLFLLTAVITGALNVWSRLAVEPLAAAAYADYRSLSPSTDAYALQQKKLISDLAKLAANGAPYLLADLLLTFLLQALVFYTALAEIRGGGGVTLRSVLQRAGGTIWSPFLTQILVYVLQLIGIGIILAVAALAFLHAAAAVVVLIFVIILLPIFIYLDLVFLVSVIVSVDSPAVRRFAAVKKAWGLVRRSTWLGLGVLIFFSIISFLYTAAFCRIGKCACSVAESVVMYWILYPLYTAVIQVATGTAFTVYYEHCVVQARNAAVAPDPAVPPLPPT